MDEIAQKLYETYANASGWQSAVSGAPLPQWCECSEAVKQCWLAVAESVQSVMDDNVSLNHIFELQATRERPWIERWRKETGKENCLPDYGEMLAWLAGKADEGLQLRERFHQLQELHYLNQRPNDENGLPGWAWKVVEEALKTADTHDQQLHCLADCKHEEFDVFTQIGRLTSKDKETVTHYTADVRVRCKQCHLAFEWVGVPAGFAYTGPHCSFDLQELRAPIRPAGASIVELEPLPSFVIRHKGN